MYLRYREPAWESSEVAEAPPARRRPAMGTRAQSKSTEGGGAIQGRPPMPFIELRGVKLHAITERRAIDHILDELDAGRGGVVVTPNLDHLRRYLADVNFRALVAEADLVVADGMPLVWASRLQGTPLPERVAGSNLISTLSGAAADRKRSIYLLGGAKDAAARAAKVLEARYPNLKVAGWHSPPMGFEKDPAQMAAIIAALSECKADIVYVGLGSPKQEVLIARLRKILPDSWWLGVGNSFSFLCGDVKRAPMWMQRYGLEWAHRLWQEPQRLFQRYVTVGMPFAVALLTRSLGSGIVNRILRRLRAPKTQSPTALAPRTTELSPVAPSTRPSLIIPAAVEAQITRNVWPMHTAGPDRSDAGAPLSRLRAVVLLGGSVRTNAFASATGRAVLDLPLDESGSILNFWLGQAAEVALGAKLDRLPVRVMVNQNSPEPISADARFMGGYRVERDQSEYRGTGGVLRDIAHAYADDDLILVANAAQILLDPLQVILANLQLKRADVTVISHDDGTPSGIMLFACKTLRLLPAEGFVDMKEQGLPLIAKQFDVRAIQCRRPTGLPVRSLEAYIQALHYYHRRRKGKPAVTDPLAEDWTPSFSLIEAGATVDASVRVHDSVVLAGACVEPGAVLVRSIVCPGAVVRRDRNAVDQLIAVERPSRQTLRGLRPPVADAK